MKINQSILRRNIWRGVLCATDQEIHEGLSFYPGAHGLCRLFASIFIGPDGKFKEYNQPIDLISEVPF